MKKLGISTSEFEKIVVSRGPVHLSRCPKQIIYINDISIFKQNRVSVSIFGQLICTITVCWIMVERGSEFISAFAHVIQYDTGNILINYMQVKHFTLHFQHLKVTILKKFQKIILSHNIMAILFQSHSIHSGLFQSLVGLIWTTQHQPLG